MNINITAGQNLNFAPAAPYHPRTHSRSASWSHTSGAATSIPLLSPIRVIQEFVPSFSAATRQSENEGSSLGLTSRSGPRHRNDNVNQMSRQSTAIDIETGESFSGNQTRSPTNGTRPSGDRVEFYGAIAWAESTLPFIILLFSRIMWDHRLG